MYQNAYSAGTPCFSYEIFEHRRRHPAPAPVLNHALRSYGPAEIKARNDGVGPVAQIPPLQPGNHQLGISLMRHPIAPGVPLWRQDNVINVGPALAFAEASLMALERRTIGIEIRFERPNVILNLAAGIPIAPADQLYAIRALMGGGYLNPMSTTIFRLRHMMPPPIFRMPVPGGGFTDCAIIHVHNHRRVSKNLKELSFNSVTNPAVDAVPYMSVKDMIDGQFPAPLACHSATIVSSDSLQTD